MSALTAAFRRGLLLSNAEEVTFEVEVIVEVPVTEGKIEVLGTAMFEVLGFGMLVEVSDKGVLLIGAFIFSKGMM